MKISQPIIRVALLILQAFLVLSCRFEEYEPEAYEPEQSADPENLPPRFISDGAVIFDTLVVGDSVRVALKVRDPDGDPVLLSASGRDAQVKKDTLYWAAKMSDTGLNIIEIYATDTKGAKDSMELRYFVRRFGRYRTVVEIKAGMEWAYEIYQGSGSIFNSNRGAGSPAYASIDTIDYRAVTGDSVSLFQRSDSLRRQTGLHWDRGQTGSDPNARFGFHEEIPACNIRTAAKVDTFQVSEDTLMVRVLYGEFTCGLANETRAYFHIPGIGLVFSNRQSIFVGSISTYRDRLVEFDGKPVNFLPYVDMINSR